MRFEKKVKAACSIAGISNAELARRIGTTPQNLHQRLKVGRFTIEEFEEIAKALGAELLFKFVFEDGTSI